MQQIAAMVKIRHGLATLNSNNSVVYGQKLIVWVLVFLVRTRPHAIVHQVDHGTSG